MATTLAALHARITGDASGFVKAAQSAGTAATTAAGKIGADAKKGLAGATNAARGSFEKLSQNRGLKMLPIQLSQVAQQAASGTGVLRALSIQAADIGLAFGGLGVIIGTVATVAMPVLLSSFMGGADAANVFEDALDSLADIRTKLEGTLDILNMSTEQLIETYGAAAAEVRQLALDLAQVQYQKAIAQTNEYQLAIEDVGQRIINLSNASGQGKRSLRQFANDMNITTGDVDRLAAALENMQNAQGIDAQIAAARDLKFLMEELGISAEDLDGDLLGIQEALLQAGIAGAQLEHVMDRIAAATKTAKSEAEGLGQTFGNVFALAGLSGAQLIPPTAPEKIDSGGGGGGGLSQQDQQEKELEALRKKLMSEIEVEQEMHDLRNETLREAKEAELLTVQEFDDLIEKERKRHHDKMAQLDVYRYGSGVQQTQAFMGQMADAFATGNEEMLRISKVFGAGEALINAWRTFSQVMSDPSLPWYAKVPTAVSLFGSAIQAVQAIQSAGKGGSGKKSVGDSGGGGETIQGGPAGAPAKDVSITLEGQIFDRNAVLGLIEGINEAVGDGARIRTA